MNAKEDYQIWCIVSGKKIASGVNANEVIAQELLKTVTEKFKRKKFCSRFQVNIWAADLVKMDQYLLLIIVFNIYYIQYISSTYMPRLNH